MLDARQLIIIKHFINHRKTIADTVKPVARAVTGGEGGNGSGFNSAPKKNLLILISVFVFLRQALY